MPHDSYPYNSAPLNAASRTEHTQINLITYEGELPSDLVGHVFFNSPISNPIHGDLPYGDNTPVFNGDGCVFRLDFTGGEELVNRSASFSNKITKTPCYHMDEILGDQGLVKFRNLGITRTSFIYGIRNQLNTAFLPYRNTDDKDRLLLTFDMGRPYDYDYNNLNIRTAIGRLDEWEDQFKTLMDYLFPMIQTTAHPVFDHVDKSVFSVNYTKELQRLLNPFWLLSEIFTFNNGALLKSNSKSKPTDDESIDMEFTEYGLRFKNALESVASKGLKEINEFKGIKNIKKKNEIKKNHIKEFYTVIDQYLIEGKKLHFKRLLKEEDEVKSRRKNMDKNSSDNLKFFESGSTDIDTLSSDWFSNVYDYIGEDKVYLKKWIDNELQTWVVQHEGNDIVLDQSIHQMGVTDKYILIMDTSFKVTGSLLINNPFGSGVIDSFIFSFLRTPVNPMTKLYIIDKQQLVDHPFDVANGPAIIQAKQVIIHTEVVHFSVDYDDNNGNNIVLYAAQNCSLCAAEWMRSDSELACVGNIYESASYTPIPADTSTSGPTVPNEYVGMPTIGEMDVSSMARINLHRNTDGTFGYNQNISNDYIEIKKNDLITFPVDHHTYGVGLYAHDGYGTPYREDANMNKMYWQFYGLNKNLLPGFIFELYGTYGRYGTEGPLDAYALADSDTVIIDPNQNTVDPNLILDKTRTGLNFSIGRTVSAMEVMDDGSTAPSFTMDQFYTFPNLTQFRSIQYVPKQLANEEFSNEEGYLVCTVLHYLDVEKYSREIWIFNGENVDAGPICKLTHKDLSFAFTIHSAWTKDLESVELSQYNIDPKTDLENRKNQFPEYVQTLIEYDFAKLLTRI